MSQPVDLSFLDRPEVLEIIFPVAYSLFPFAGDPGISATGTPHYTIEVEEGIKVDCGFWVCSEEAPSMLYFHGNGETVADYELIAPLYNERGINLFVAEYRGYGASGGKPTVTNMLGDSCTVFREFRDIIRREGFNESLFIMGRSLGSMPAIEVARAFQKDIRGLIVESGTANNIPRFWNHLDDGVKQAILSGSRPFLNKLKIRDVRHPTLIIHGEYDEILPLSEGEELYRNSGAGDKDILIIPGAGHNDIMLVEQDLYFGTIEEFIQKFVVL